MFGLAKDVEQLMSVIAAAGMGYKVSVRDPLEPPIQCDIAIHIEVPVFAMMPWASVNCLLVNPEWYSEEWDSYSDRMDYYFVRDSDSQKRLQERFPMKSVTCLPWCLPALSSATATAHPESTRHSDGFAWFVGGSKNKRSAVQWLAPQWKATYPPLFVFSVDAIDLSGVTCSPNVTFKTGNITDENKKKLTAFFPGQVCVSEAEAFSYATAEAEAAGAFVLLNSLPVYKEKYTDTSFISWIETPTSVDGLAARATFQETQELEKQLDAAIQKFLSTDLEHCRTFQKETTEDRRKNCLKLWKNLGVWKELDEKAENKSFAQLPPILLPEDCPPISVVTLLYNRRRFFDLACHNIMLSDYPKDKIEWIVVEDSDDPNEDASDRVVQVGMQSAPLQLIYCPIGQKTPIAEKRNMGVARATNNIILFMDDDDHYPETSFRRRVAWLTKHPWQPKAVACTTIACYDLIRGVSAVNTPPFALGFSKRISEATLAFYKDFWTERNFNAADSISEGEFFLQGREPQCLELPPQQMIVAFSHRKNTSGRRIPSEDAKPGCFWGFPTEYLHYVHNLAGITVEEETE